MIRNHGRAQKVHLWPMQTFMKSDHTGVGGTLHLEATWPVVLPIEMVLPAEVHNTPHDTLPAAVLA